MCEGLGLYLIPCAFPIGSPSVPAGILHVCCGLKIELKQGEVTVIHGFTTA